MSGLAWFFAPEARFMIERSGGFETLGTAHLVVIAVCAVVAALLVRRYAKLPQGLEWGSPRRRQLVVMAIIPPILLASRAATLIHAGLFWPLFWPLHICNLCEYFCLVFALCPHGRFGRGLGNLIFCWGVVGGVGAVLFPGWSWYCPLFCWASLCGFAGHALMLAFAFCLVVGRDVRLDVRWVWLPALAGVVGATLFRVVNPLLGTNFFFVTDPASAGPPFAWGLATFGDPGFLAVYLVIVLAIWLALYAVARIVARLVHWGRS